MDLFFIAKRRGSRSMEAGTSLYKHVRSTSAVLSSSAVLSDDDSFEYVCFVVAFPVVHFFVCSDAWTSESLSVDEEFGHGAGK